ncbi:MAG: alcohol dehydrogenase catalytic domain-containing protein [Elusimicrobia bacterium]|nr:alcohol dehydrogenase catalytic domain-containing protein [Elusimicrobiota bacterium]
MKAIVYKQSSGASLTDLGIPPISEAEALIDVAACGLCGTDLMKLASKPAQAVLGHEIAGTIARLGKKAKGFKEGDRVVLAHHVPCLDCHYCRRGSVSMCRQFKATNVEPGGFSEQVRASELHVKHALLKIPKGLGFTEASQTEPLACCLRNVKRLGSREGDTVGIVGLGAVGLMTAQLLALRGASVLGLDLDESRAAGLSPYGRGFAQSADFDAAVRTATQGRGLDALVFTAGPASMVSERLGWLRDGGTLNVFASFHPSQTPVDLNAIYHRELTIMSSYSPHPDDLRESLALIASGAVSIAALKPRTFGLEQFDEAARQVKERRLMKALLSPLAGAAR